MSINNQKAVNPESKLQHVLAATSAFQLNAGEQDNQIMSTSDHFRANSVSQHDSKEEVLSGTIPILNISKKNLEAARRMRDLALKHCQRNENFDVLTQAYLCSNDLLAFVPQLPDGTANLPALRALNATAYELAKECLLFSCIAYVQLDQYQQAILLSSQVAKALSTADVEDRLLVLVIQAKAFQLLRKPQEASIALNLALTIKNDQRLRMELSTIQASLKASPQKAHEQPSRMQRLQKSDSNTATPGDTHWLSDKWDSESEHSTEDLISTFKSRTTKASERLTIQPFQSAKPVPRLRKLPNKKTSLTHPMNPSMIDFDSDLTKFADIKNLAKKNEDTIERHTYLLQFFVSKLPKKQGREVENASKPKELDFFQQCWLLVRRVFRFIQQNPHVQLLIAAFLLVYAYIAYRVLRYLKLKLRTLVEMNVKRASLPVGRCFFDLERHLFKVLVQLNNLIN